MIFIEGSRMTLRKPNKILQISLLLFFCFTCVTTEVFTSNADMENLVDTLGKVAETLENYVHIQNLETEYLQRKLDEVAREHTQAKSNRESYVQNPLNLYLLTRRLTHDWKQIENLMLHDAGTDIVKKLARESYPLVFPTDEDLKGVVTSILRLQSLYKISAEAMANGTLNGIDYKKELDSNDCFIVAKECYDNGDFKYAALWFEEAWRRLEENGTIEQTTEVSLLEHWAYSAYKVGNHKLARAVAREMLRADPNCDSTRELVEVYEDNYYANYNLNKETEEPIEETDIQFSTDSDELKKREKYESLCRGDLSRKPSYLRQLKCKYLDTSLFSKIAPYKMEEVNVDPPIVMYHEVISNYEIEVIKGLALPKFSRAGTYDADNGTRFSNYRIAKLAWLPDTENKVVAVLSKRIGDITGLNMTTSEQLQVVNYGIGGHYQPHHDFARKEENSTFRGTEHMGNRIATFLYYMSDVEQGGATVFPALDLTVFPKKGSATFWWNLFKSGDGDFRTMHASCPVLVGSKWICNKWVHEYDQQYSRPCGIEQDAPPETEVKSCFYCH